MNHQPTDPPMEPLAGSARWFESGPEPIVNNLNLAVLIVRIGMASNALSAQLHAGADASRRRGAARMRDSLLSFVTTAAFTNEAIRLAREQMSTLGPLAARAGAERDLLDAVSKLCAGKHPSAQVLKHARNKVGFHWDQDLITRSVREYGRNQKVVWVESDAQFHPVHRLAAEVLGHALFPEAVSQSEQGKRHEGFRDAMSQVREAMRVIIKFFTACVYGYMELCDATRRTRVAPKQGALKSDRKRASTRKRP
jgi:hypothetical protein